jgi:hypothetical protein
MMKKWYMFVVCFTLASAIGCGSPKPTVVPAPAENVDDMPGVDQDSAEYQKSMSGQ